MIHCVYHGYSFVEMIWENHFFLINPFIDGNEFCDSSIDDMGSKNIEYVMLTSGDPKYINSAIQLVNSSSNTKIICTGHVADMIFSTNLLQKFDSIIINDFSNGLFDVSFIGDKYANHFGFIMKLTGKIVYFGSDNNFIDQESFDSLIQLGKVDLSFVSIDEYKEFDKKYLDEISVIKSGIVVPIHYNSLQNIVDHQIDFAREVMLENYSVPKPLRAGQYVVLN